MARLTLILGVLAIVIQAFDGFRFMLNEWRRWRNKGTWMAVLLCCLMPTTVWAEDLYVGQADAGLADGTSCANQHSAAWFNTAANWGGGAGEIDPGDTAHLCGTITSTLTVQASGTAGNAITILFETGAIIQQPACDATNGCLKAEVKSYIIIDGGSTCGWVAGALVACNGTIQSTLNGTAGAACIGGACSSQVSSRLLVVSACTRCEVRNLNLLGNYLHTTVGDVSLADVQATNAIYANNVVNPTVDLLIHHNIILDCGWCVRIDYGNDTGTLIHHNDLSRAAHGFVLAGSGTVNATGSKIYNNNLHDYDNWDTGVTDAYHLAGIHAYGTATATTTGTQVYNNKFSGNVTTNDLTAHIYMEDHQFSSLVFNNLILAPTTGTASFGFIALGGGTGGTGPSAYNNTILDNGNGICILVSNAAGAATITLKNNICVGAKTGVYFYSTGTYVMNYNLYTAMVGSNLFWDGSGYSSTIAAWRTATSQEANSQLVGTGNVNSDGTLTANSLAIDTGVDLSGLSITALNSDYLGNARYAGAAWDTGAIEYGAGDTIRRMVRLVEILLPIIGISWHCKKWIVPIALSSLSLCVSMTMTMIEKTKTVSYATALKTTQIVIAVTKKDLA